MRTRLSVAALVGVLVGLAALLAPGASAESSPSAFADRLVSLINAARQQNGLRALTVTSGTSTVAASWTQHLDQQQALSHNPDLGPQLESHGSPNWTAYGENVGDGPTSSADTLFNAYMNSPEHRDNILGSAYRYLGIGVVFDGSTAWNTLDFVDQYSSTTKSTSTTTTTSKPRTAPKPVAHVAAAPKPAPRPAVARPASPVRHVAAKPARPAQPAAKPAAVKAVATTAPAAAAPVAAAPMAHVAAALPAPVQLPGGRDTLPFVVAAAMILLVVASRYVVEVLPRRA